MLRSAFCRLQLHILLLIFFTCSELHLMMMQILEKLYHPKHIAIAHELIKLISIELSLGDRASAEATFARAEVIFSLYYGPDVQRILPYVDALKRTVSGRFLGAPWQSQEQTIIANMCTSSCRMYEVTLINQCTVLLGAVISWPIVLQSCYHCNVLGPVILRFLKFPYDLTQFRAYEI